jgi:hypothetical protein
MDYELDDLSRHGLHMRTTEPVELGSTITIKLRLGQDEHDTSRALSMMVKGRVARVEPRPGGGYGVTVEFTGHPRFT